MEIDLNWMGGGICNISQFHSNAHSPCLSLSAVGTNASALRDGRERCRGHQPHSGEERSEAGGQGFEGQAAQLLLYEQGGHFTAARGGGEVVVEEDLKGASVHSVEIGGC